MTFLSRSELDTEKTLTAMILAPTLEDAVEMLALDGKTTTVEYLRTIERGPTMREVLEKRRNELAPLIEGELANRLLTVAGRAAAATELAVQKTQEMLDQDKVRDPSRVARDLAQVTAQSIEKRLSIQGRPTQIVEHRDVNEILRGLQKLGIVHVDAIEGSASEEMDADE